MIQRSAARAADPIDGGNCLPCTTAARTRRGVDSLIRSSCGITPLISRCYDEGIEPDYFLPDPIVDPKHPGLQRLKLIHRPRGRRLANAAKTAGVLRHDAQQLGRNLPAAATWSSA